MMAYKGNKIKIKISLKSFNKLIAYSISKGDFVTERTLRNIKSLVDRIDTSYEIDNDVNLKIRYDYLNKIINSRIEYQIEDVEDILEYPLDTIYEDKLAELQLDIEEINKDRILANYVNLFISDRMENIFMYEQKEELIKAYNVLNNPTATPSDVIKNIRQRLEKLLTDIRNVDVRKEEATEFNGRSEITAETALQKTNIYYNTDDKKLVSGLKHLNKIIGGWFEPRVYMFCGSSGRGKSMFLASLAAQVTLNNPNYIPEPNKSPEVILLIHETKMEETLQRLYTMYCIEEEEDDKIGKSLVGVSVEEMRKQLMRVGLIRSKEDKSSISLYIKSVPTATMTREDMDDMIHERKIAGYEPVMLIHDQLYDIKAPSNEEMRIALSNNVSSYSGITMKYGIPVVSACQLNGEGQAIVEEAFDNSELEAVKRLCVRHIAESKAIYHKTDFFIFINKEINKRTGEEYLGFKADKTRSGCSIKDRIFYQPYDRKCNIRLMEDVNIPTSLRKLSIVDPIDDTAVTNTNVTSYKNNIKTKEEIMKENKADNVFDVTEYLAV